MSFLENTVLSIIMLGNTHYVDVGQDSDAIIYYENAHVAHMILPGQTAWRGDLTMKDDGYHVSWENGPAGDWKIRHDAGQFTYINPEGKEAGTITMIVPGNPENF